MVLPFIAKRKFCRIYGFFPGPSAGAQRPIEEACVRRGLAELQYELRRNEIERRAIVLKYTQPDEKTLEISPQEMRDDQKLGCFLDEERRKLERRQKRAIRAAVRCGFEIIEVYNECPRAQEDARDDVAFWKEIKREGVDRKI